MRFLPRCPLSLTPLLLALPLLAQEAGRGEGIPGIVAAQVAPPADGLDVPPPPRALRREPTHWLPPIPVAPPNGIPQPQSPETIPHQPGQQVVTAPGDFTLFMNRAVTPVGASTSTIGEPSVAINRDIAFCTGNWYAALSEDSGMTWTYVNPSTRFPASDGGFCCDQRTIYVPSHDLTVWLLQYDQGGVNLNNRYRIAAARGRNALKANSWIYADFTPGMFGHGQLGKWLDFPDLAYGQDHLYVSTNVFGSGPGAIDAIVWRVDLNDMQNNSSWSYVYQRNTLSLGGGYSYRFTQGAVSSMWFATHASNSDLRIYSWPESSNTITFYDRGIAAFGTGSSLSITPDGYNWMGRADTRTLGGYITGSEIGFLWNVPQNFSSRLQPYVRVSRFLRSGVTYIADHDIWNSTRAFGYPCVTTNANSHMGGTIAFGGTTTYPAVLAFMVDADSSVWAPLDTATVRIGSNGPSRQVWGDYFSVQRHPVKPETWIASGMTMQGGNANGDSEPRYVWFGRERDDPGTVSLSVSSTGATGVTIDVGMMDRNGLRDGNTPFTRAYSVSQGYRMTAPLTFTVQGVTSAFSHWILNGTPQPVGDRVLDVDTIGAAADTAVAAYVARNTLTILSTNPASGTAITVSPADIQGAGNGNTSLTRYYRDNEVVTLTAPLTTPSGSRFQYWMRTGGRLPDPNRTIQFNLLVDSTWTAVYYRHTVGTHTTFGTGCPGSNGVATHHVSGTPEIGLNQLYQVHNGPFSSATLMVLGFSRTTWGAIPLPLLLTGAGAPGCRVYVSPDVIFATATNATQGYGQVPISIPDDLSLIGGHFFTQFWNVDLAANALHLTFTDAIDTFVGGYFP
jgi:hypothetical protein